MYDFWIKFKSWVEYLWRRKKLMNDREAFDEFVYTDVNEAVKELHRRQNDPKLKTGEEMTQTKRAFFESFLWEYSNFPTKKIQGEKVEKFF